jgi:hypothetical protein
MAWARHLAGKPRVAWPRIGDHTETLLAKQHHSFFSFARDGDGREKFAKDRE